MKIKLPYLPRLRFGTLGLERLREQLMVHPDVLKDIQLWTMGPCSFGGASPNFHLHGGVRTAWMGMEEAALEVKIKKTEDPRESDGPGWKAPRRGRNAGGQRNWRLSSLKGELPTLDRVDEWLIGGWKDGRLKRMVVHSKIYRMPP